MGDYIGEYYTGLRYDGGVLGVWTIARMKG